jgi:hypothetical protein
MYNLLVITVFLWAARREKLVGAAGIFTTLGGNVVRRTTIIAIVTTAHI